MKLEYLIPWVPWGILILLVVGAICQYSAWSAYSSELKGILKLKDAIKVLLKAVPRGDVVKADDLLEQEVVSIDSMVGVRTREIEIFSSYPGMVALHDLGAVAAEADAGRLRNAIPGVLIASLLVFGLFGTLLSLKETLQSESMQSIFEIRGEADSGMEFQKALKGVVAGFGQAFLASICGVGATIFLIIVRVFVRAKREKCFEALEKFAVEQLLPYYITPEKELLARATTLLDNGTTHFDGATKRLQQSAEAFQKSISRINDSSDQFSKVFGKGGGVAFQLAEFTEATKFLHVGIGEIANSANATTSALQHFSGESLGLLAQIDQKTIDQEKRRNVADDLYVELIEELQASVKTSENAVSSSIGKLEDTNVAILGRSSELRNELVKNFGESISKLTEENTRLINGLVKYTKVQDDRHKPVQEEWSLLIKGFSDSNSEQLERNKALIEGLIIAAQDQGEQQVLRQTQWNSLVEDFRKSISSLAADNSRLVIDLVQSGKDQSDKADLRQAELKELFEVLADRLNERTDLSSSLADPQEYTGVRRFWMRKRKWFWQKSGS